MNHATLSPPKKKNKEKHLTPKKINVIDKIRDNSVNVDRQAQQTMIARGISKRQKATILQEDTDYSVEV